jgi:asparagine synthase (glutamine-hydrolysing)
MLGSMYKHGDMKFGSVSFEDLHVYAGWTCHSGSYADCLPVTSRKGDITILFGGEHIAPSSGDEGKRARDAGHPLDKASALLSLYEEMGEDIIPLLNGFFHGLIIDSRAQKAILFNDRFGMQRLYFHEDSDALLFSSEAKAILAIRPALRAFDPTGLGEWLSCGCVLENRSLYKGIQVLPGGTAWVWRADGSSVRRKYFSPETWERQEAMGMEEFYPRLRSTFRTILPDYLRGESPIGLSTTGGLDTRMILANIDAPREAVRCYSFGGPYRECLDVAIGRTVAQEAGYAHTVIDIDDLFFKRFAELAERVVSCTDGNIELSGTPNLYVNEHSRRISAIRLTGNYGSEVLRRHRAFSPSNSACLVLSPDFSNFVRSTEQKWSQTRAGNRMTFVAFKQVPWYSYNRLQVEQSLLTMRSPFMDNRLLEVVYRAPAEATASGLVSLRLIADGNPKLGKIMTDRGITYPRTPLWPIARAYYEFLFKMEYYAGHGMPTALAAIDRRLGPLSIEKLFLGKHKYYHLRQWFRDGLAGFVREMALDERTLKREYLSRTAFERAVRAHLAGAENHTHSISKILTLEFISRIFFKNG